MSVYWDPAADPIIEGDELKHEQLELSPCCNAPLEGHWPCEEKAQCSLCRECSICGSNFEYDGIREHEDKKRRSR